MTANIIVTGLPVDAQFRKIMYSLKAMFKKIQIKKFWIRDLSETYGLDEKQMTIEFNTDSEARKARNYLDNFPFPHPTTKQEYVLSAHLDEGVSQPMEYEEDRRWAGERRPRQKRRDRQQAWPRSPSPGYRSEASKLDLEIELLRKQRQVIEEERRLLVERKKLDMIREYGPSASRDFIEYDDLEPPRKRRLPPTPMEVKKPRHRSPPPPKPTAPRNTHTLPAFFQPCKKLLADMRELIEQDCTSEEKEILIKLIRAALRKNLAIALEGKAYMATGDIIKLYRELHPRTGDEAFVKKILANIRASYLPDELESKLARVKKEPKETDDESRGNASDDKVGDKEGKQEVTKTESQDKPANGDNKTDADTDFTADVTVDLSTPVKPDQAANKDLPAAETTTDDKLVTAKEPIEAEVAATTEANRVEEATGNPDTVDETTEATGESKSNTVGESIEAKDGVKTDEPLKSEEKAELLETGNGNAVETAVQS